MKVRLLSCVLVVMLLATSFVGCSSKNDTNTSSDKAATTETGKDAGETEANKSGDKTTVTMWVMPNSGDPENNLKEVLAPFLEQNKDIDVQLTVLDWGSAWTKITTAATSGEGPDITQLGTTQVAAVAAMGALEEMTGIYDKFGGEEAFVPATLPTTQILGAGEERYAAPWFIDTRALFYRKDICEAAGVNPETDFETWDKFKAALGKMKSVTVDGKEVYNMCTLKRDYYYQPKEGVYSQVEFLEAVHVYLNSSMEELLQSDNTLIKILVTLDRRVGKTTLVNLKDTIANDEEIVQYFYQLRCNAEGMKDL